MSTPHPTSPGVFHRELELSVIPEDVWTGQVAGARRGSEPGLPVSPNDIFWEWIGAEKGLLGGNGVGDCTSTTG